ncbi:MAG TPA: DUF3810 domain-containing protein [Flavisolibacter sp.]
MKFSPFLRDRILLLLLLLTVLLKLFARNEEWVERYYTFGVYPYLSRGFRTIFGWIPFSVGDLLYIVAAIFLLLKTWKYLRAAIKGNWRAWFNGALARKIIRALLIIYLAFNVLWGLNYDRVGVAKQFDLEVPIYNKADLLQLTAALQKQLCRYAEGMDTAGRRELDNNQALFGKGVSSFAAVQPSRPYLEYTPSSIKASLITPLGRYFGFTGYYNPFTSEAQLKTSVPSFVKPFVLCHEIAHQLGYAKENEANFISFIVARSSPDVHFRYSVYFDMYLYALAELVEEDFTAAWMMANTAHPQVKRDRRAYAEYLRGEKNSIEPFVSSFYDQYLKLNNQPKGRGSYNQVVGWLIALMKKEGAASI